MSPTCCQFTQNINLFIPVSHILNFRCSRLGERQSRNSLRRAAKPSDKKISLPLVAQKVKRPW